MCSRQELKTRDDKKKRRRTGSLYVHCKSLIGSRERQVCNRKSDFHIFGAALLYVIIKWVGIPALEVVLNKRLSKNRTNVTLNTLIRLGKEHRTGC